jgi:hypothetical protein
LALTLRSSHAQLWVGLLPLAAAKAVIDLVTGPVSLRICRFVPYAVCRPGASHCTARWMPGAVNHLGQFVTEYA